MGMAVGPKQKVNEGRREEEDNTNLLQIYDTERSSGEDPISIQEQGENVIILLCFMDIYN